jgi:integrase
VWTVSQTAEFLTSIRDHHLYELYLLITLLGLRRGEAAGLRWCDVDLDARVLMVSHQVQDHSGRTVICPPKTENGVRYLALDHHLVAALRALRSQRQRALPKGHVPTGFLFPGRAGGPMSPGYLTHTFTRLIAAADLPPIRLHDLRHGAASLSLAAGNDLKTVQELMGHASIVLSADTYTSVLPCLAHHSAEKTAALVMKAVHRTSSAVRQRSRRAKHNRRPRAHSAASQLTPAAAKIV